MARSWYWCFLGVSLICACGHAETAINLAEVTRPAPSYPGKLPESAVVMRGLHPRGEETMQALRDFHVTHLEWIYDLNQDFVRKVRAAGISVSGVVSTASELGIDR